MVKSEVKDNEGNASGQRVYLQLKSGESYLYKHKDGNEIFTIQNENIGNSTPTPSCSPSDPLMVKSVGWM